MSEVIQGESSFSMFFREWGQHKLLTIFLICVTFTYLVFWLISLIYRFLFDATE